MRRTVEERTVFLAQRAAEMRRQPTPAERILRDMLAPLGFEFQVPIMAITKNGGQYSYILDAWHPISKLAIECDGSAHRRQRGRDRRRDQRLATDGVRTLRFTNSRVLKEPSVVLVEIKEALAPKKDHSQCYMPCDDPWCDTLYCKDCGCGPMVAVDYCDCECHDNDERYGDDA
jgi:very-short-patch-repair endonuclease